MADYTRHEKTTTTVRYVLALPSNGIEVDKMLYDAHRERAGGDTVASLPDDAVTASVEDDLLVLSWVKS